MRSVSACRIGLVSIEVHLKTHIRGNADRHVVEDKPPVAAFDCHRDAIAMGDAQDQRIKWRHMNMSLGNNRPAAQLQFGKGAYQADPRRALQIAGQSVPIAVFAVIVGVIYALIFDQILKRRFSDRKKQEEM